LRRTARLPLVARVAIDRAAAALKTIHWAARSDPDRWAGYHVRAIARAPDRGYRVSDGFVTLDFCVRPARGMARAMRRLGLDAFADPVGDGWFSTIGMEDRIDWARPHYERALAGFTRAEAVALIRRHGGWSVPFQSPPSAHPPAGATHASAFSPMDKRRCDCRGASITRRRRRIPRHRAPVGAHTREALAALAAEEVS
jgi:hypothetical protein